MSTKFKDLYDRHIEMIQEEQRKNERLAIGTLCSYVPVEILHAFNILPVRLWGQSEDISQADALLQIYICPPARHIMALGLAGHYDFLDGIVHSYTCDATCGLFNIWCRNLKPKFSFLLSPPYIDIDEAIEYSLAEHRGFITALENFTKKRFSVDRLRRSINLYNEARAYIKEIYDVKHRGAPVSYLDIYYINLCLQVLPVEMLISLYQDYLLAAKEMVSKGSGKYRILLSGSVISDVDIMGLIEQRGGDIVVDDTCLGFRLVQDRINEDEDPLTALVKYYLRRPPCSSRADFPARKNHVLEMISLFDVDAVIFMHQKFCDPHLSDHPFLKKVLDEKGIPQMQLELEEEEGLTGQVQTRLESFFEILEGK
ncbi:MAG: 2-hydroxyacyl-CoA dehydratase [Deltaproteobacteria bacterium]|nr:2-hydroxyacyl-CoA dehydratase [Deltaproteobacteria bacterium]